MKLKHLAYGLPALHLKQYKTCHSVNSCKTLLKFTLFKTDLNKFTVGTLTILAGTRKTIPNVNALTSERKLPGIIVTKWLAEFKVVTSGNTTNNKKKKHQYLSRQSYE